MRERGGRESERESVGKKVREREREGERGGEGQGEGKRVKFIQINREHNSTFIINDN